MGADRVRPVADFTGENLNEEWHHRQFAERDLDELEGRGVR